MTYQSNSLKSAPSQSTIVHNWNMIGATIYCDQNHITQMAPLPQQDCRCNQCNDAAKSKLFLLKENILWNLINNVNNCCKKFRKKEVRKYKYIYNVVSCSCLLLDTSEGIDTEVRD